MNPRAFCREPGYSAAILLTYDFDPLFFEQLVLQDLWAGGTGDVLVIADARRIDDTIGRWRSPLRQLGRRYQLAKAKVPGSFHPKVILRVGASGGALWIGSGNLTAGGWGGNRELATAWRFGPGLPDAGDWVARFLDQIQSWYPDELHHDVLARAHQLPWIGDLSQSQAEPPFLASTGDRSLAHQLRRRWSGREFEEARIVTGSTDRNGALLGWLHRTFGVKRCRIVVDPGRAAFEADHIEKLPLSVDVLSAQMDSPVHAKLVWLRGARGDAVVMGSANCSAAGWLQSPEHGGNVEVVVVYDTVSGEALGDAAQLFERADLKPVPLRDAVEVPPERFSSIRIPILEVGWERESGTIIISLGKAIGRQAEVVLQLEGRHFRCQPGDSEGSWWLAELSPSFEGKRGALLCEIVFTLSEGAPAREVHWVNDLGELRHSARGRQISEVLVALRAPSSQSEQQQILAELQRISIALLTEPSAFPDPFARRPAIDLKQEDLESDAPALNPDELIRSMEEITKHKSHGEVSGAGRWLSLLGVMKALFDLDDVDSQQLEQAADDVNEADPEDGSHEPASQATPMAGEARKTKREAPSDRSKERLAKQMRRFLDQLSSIDFGAHCTATQLVQAAAYPLAVAALGRRGQWVIEKDSEGWAMAVFDALFRGERGLLTVVEARYRESGRQEDFSRIVGDGTLWLVLLVSLSSLDWSGAQGALERALAVRSVLRQRELLASAHAGRVHTLFARLDTLLAQDLIEKAPRAVALLDELEEHIERQWEGLLSAQETNSIVHAPGDLLWRKGIGWGVALEEAAAQQGAKLELHLHYRGSRRRVMAAGYYVNVTKAAQSDPTIEDLMAQLLPPQHRGTERC